MEWDLSHILPSLEASDTKPAFDALEQAVVAIERQKGSLDELDRKGLTEALHALGELHETSALVGYRGMLAFSANTEDDQAKTFMERAQAIGTEAGNRVRFLTQWLKELPDDRVGAVMPEEADLAHFVRTVRAARPYRLPEDIERIIADKDMTGVSALVQTREIITSSFRFTDPVSGEQVTQSDISRHVYGADRDVRRAAYQEVQRVFDENASVLAHIYRSIVRDWNTENLKHRSYPRSMTPMNLANEVADEVVATMLDVCVDHRKLWQDYFHWKAKVVGEPFDRHDIYAPIEAEGIEIGFDEARHTVMRVFEGFHPRYAQLAERVFDERHVDAFPRPNKRGGAFCATVQTRMTPYVMLNHTNDARSVSTMAHELGHAIHSMLAEDRHPLVSSAPLPLAETASVFSELLLHHHLVAEHPEATTAIVSERLADLYATIQRQAYFARFEIEAHRMVMENEPTERLNEVYLSQLREQFGPLEVPDAFAKEWLVIPHFNASPFYVSSYSFGALLSLSLYGRYAEDASFRDAIVDILAAGGSRDPQELLAEHDIDIASAGFWEGGMAVVEGMVEQLREARP